MEQKINNRMRQLIVFKLENEEYGIDTTKVKYIERMMTTTRVPKTPSFVKGVINLRGEIIPVIDLRDRFNLPPAEETEETRIIIVRVDEIQAGIIVDIVLETIQLSEDNVESITGLGDDQLMDYIMGVGKINNRIINLLNLDKLLKVI